MNRKKFISSAAILYLKYGNRGSEFVDNLFSVLNWGNVADRYNMARKIG